MELMLVRHGIAEPFGAGTDDRARRLTDEGRARFERGVRGLASLGVELERVHHSPFARAAETAALLAPLLASGGELVASPGLATAPDEALLAELDGERVALVGHEPWMGALCAWLTTGESERGHAFRFDPGGVARLAGRPAPGAMELVAFLPPPVLVELGG